MSPRPLLTAASLALLPTVAAEAQDLSCTSAPSVAPAVVWEVHATTGQTGWNGILNPQSPRFPPYTFDNVTQSNGVWSAGPTARFWSASWEYDLGGQPSSCEVDVVIDGGSFLAIPKLEADWKSQFLLEVASVRIDVIAWIRGGPGTVYEVSRGHLGELFAARLNYGGSLQAAGQTVSFPSPTAAVAQLEVLEPFQQSMTDGVSRTFSEYPGVLYSRGLTDHVAVDLAAWQSCILGCPGSFIDGTGSLTSGVTVRLPVGVDPEIVSLTTSTLSADSASPPVPLGTPVTPFCLALDPDDGSAPGAGIVRYRWWVNGQYEPSTCGPVGPTVRVRSGRSVLFTVQVVDDEGMLALRSAAFTSQAPRPVSPEPRGAR